MMPRTPLPVALACLLALVVTGCSELSGTGSKGYVSGEGQITVVAEAERGQPIDLSGKGLGGKPLSLAELRGTVVVVNVWGSWCPPCRAEQPDLVDAADELGNRAAFLGINVRDASASQSRAYVRRFEVPYPSLYSPSGEALLAFEGTLSPRSIPSTVVLDRRGRVAARVLGSIPSTGTLVDVVDEVVDEDG